MSSSITSSQQDFEGTDDQLRALVSRRSVLRCGCNPPDFLRRRPHFSAVLRGRGLAHAIGDTVVAVVEVLITQLDSSAAGAVTSENRPGGSPGPAPSGLPADSRGTGPSANDRKHDSGTQAAWSPPHEEDVRSGTMHATYRGARTTVTAKRKERGAWLALVSASLEGKRLALPSPEPVTPAWLTEADGERASSAPATLPTGPARCRLSGAVARTGVTLMTSLMDIVRRGRAAQPIAPRRHRRSPGIATAVRPMHHQGG